MAVAIQSEHLWIAPRVAVRLSGTGGQGLLLAGRVLAEAAAIHDGLNVVQTNSYGPEARGGASRSEVVMSPGPVDDLRSAEFEILVCLSQKACDLYHHSVRPRGLFIVDSTNVTVVPTSRVVEVPMTMLAISECGNGLVTNMISLGVLCGCSDVVTFASLKSAIKSTVRSEFLPLNLKAVELGYSEGQQALRALAPRLRRAMPRFSAIREASAPHAA